ncbi:MAG: L-aspartate oxidase [Bacillus sp. (in: firmicutes)]
MHTYETDVLIIGSGIAAIQTAIYASRTKRVTIVTKAGLRDSNSFKAQGGIAVALHPDDTIESHCRDTLMAGDYHNDPEMVCFLARKGKKLIGELIENGLHFDRDDKLNLLFALEGAHSNPRILHNKGDATGRELVNFMIGQLRETRVELKEQETAVELLVSPCGSCTGAVTRDKAGHIHIYHSSHTVLATGGCGRLYPYTTNGHNAYGDGYAMAFKAGAVLTDMEFVQFHPTALAIGVDTKGLVSEAVRGEGGKLIDETGRQIMAGVHPLEDLAPRHIVSGKVYRHMRNGHSVYLDIRAIEQFDRRFPAITELCKANRIDWEAGKLPVSPASHYMMGGIRTDIYGRTDIEGLYAVGEVACTGIHGANRLASNSLLECLVFGKELGIYLKEAPNRPKGLYAHLPIVQENVTLPLERELQAHLFNFAGITRTETGLRELADWLEKWELDSLITGSWIRLPPEKLRVASMLVTGSLIVYSALKRKESRGGHIRTDYPEQSLLWKKKYVNIDKVNRKGIVANEQKKTCTNA